MALSTDRPVGKDVFFMMTCLCDAFYADVARAAVEILEHVGCRVHVPEDQTCCGQPPFNGGDFKTSREIARHTAKVFAGDWPIIVPSGSCAAMQFHGNALQFEDQSDSGELTAMGNRTWELFDYLVHGLGLTDWQGTLEKRVAIHHACHTRGTQTGAAIETLLGSIEGIELLPFGQGEQCCGFGGTFSVTFPNISAGMGTLKLDHVLDQQPDLLVSADMSCLMHLSGLAEKQQRPIPHQHATQVLRAALASA